MDVELDIKMTIKCLTLHDVLVIRGLGCVFQDIQPFKKMIPTPLNNEPCTLYKQLTI